MRKAFIALIVGIIFLGSLSVNQIEKCSAAGDTLHVGSGQTYSTIQEAIVAASASDTVYVHSGTYSENIVINKTLILTGEGSSVTTISGSGDHTIKVISNNVQISDFTISNTGSSYSCVFLESVTGCWVTFNTITNAGNGIYLVSSDSNHIKNNTAKDSNIGIYLSNSDSNTVQGNNIYNNNANGIFLASTSDNNVIYLNDFSENTENNARDEGSNTWSYNSQGNYWDDYNDYDSDDNGIGDNPYSISGSGVSQDNYPLGDFLSSNQQPVAYIDSITPNPAIHGQTVYFNGHASDDGAIAYWEWKANDVIIGTSEDTYYSGLSPGTHTISFRVRDDEGNWADPIFRTLIINTESGDNEKPTAVIQKPETPRTIVYGDSLEFLALGYDTDGQVVGYSWRSNIDGILSGNRYFTKNDLTIGQHTVYLKVRDDEGAWSTEVSTSVTVTANPDYPNIPPVANAGGPYSGYTNVDITFDGSESYDSDAGDSITYSWYFGDGSNGEDVSPTHNYTSAGNFTITLTVTDSYGNQSTSTTYAVITSQSNGGTDGDGIPGFEAIIFLIAIALIIFYKRSKKNFK
jgi:parallel beta-helix repeat protein